MELKHLIYKNCPTCHARITSESQPWIHTSGKPFEIIEFSCGCKLSWSPNFEREEVYRICPKHPDILKENERRKKAAEKMRNYLSRLDVDNNFKLTIETAIRNLL